MHHGLMMVRPPAQRALEIRRILDARFSLSVFEEWQRRDPEWWGSARNDMGRGIYGEALREAARLEAASDGVLDAELADLAR
jgi:hypothetical protein